MIDECLIAQAMFKSNGQIHNLNCLIGYYRSCDRILNYKFIKDSSADTLLWEHNKSCAEKGLRIYIHTGNVQSYKELGCKC